MHPEAVERDHGDPVGQRLDRRRRAHRDQTGGGLERGRHRRVREHEVRRAARREETGVRITVEVGLGLPGRDRTLTTTRRDGSASAARTRMAAIAARSSGRRGTRACAAKTTSVAPGRRTAAGVPSTGRSARAMPPAPRRALRPPRTPGDGCHSTARDPARRAGSPERAASAPDALAELGEGTAFAVRVHDQQVGVSPVVERPALGGDRHAGEPRDGHRTMPQCIDDSAQEADERSPPGEQHHVRALDFEPSGHALEVEPRDVEGAEAGARQRRILLRGAHRQRRAHQQELRSQVGHGPSNDAAHFTNESASAMATTRIPAPAVMRARGGASPSAPARCRRRA